AHAEAGHAVLKIRAKAGKVHDPLELMSFTLQAFRTDDVGLGGGHREKRDRGKGQDETLGFHSNISSQRFRGKVLNRSRRLCVRLEQGLCRSFRGFFGETLAPTKLIRIHLTPIRAHSAPKSGATRSAT